MRRQIRLNGCTWAHIVEAATSILDRSRGDFLLPGEVDALVGAEDPNVLSKEP